MKKSLFSFLDFTKPGKDKPEPTNPFLLFWYRYQQRFFSLIQVNLLFFLLTFPFYVWVMMLYNSYVVTEGLQGISLMAALAAYALEQVPVPIQIGLVVVSGFCWGPANAGITLVAGKYAAGEHAWPWADFWGAFKANIRQGLLFGLLEAIVIFVSFYYFTETELYIQSGALRIAWMVLLFFYLLARAYVYPVMTRVKQPAHKLIKNAFILAFIKPWRPLACLLITAVFVLLTAVADMVVLPLFAYAFIAYAGSALTYPVLHKYLLQPSMEAQRKAQP